MKKFILYIVVFFAAIVFVDLVFGQVVNYMTSNAKSGATKRTIDLCKNSCYDMLIMGSSKAHHNYNPQVFCDTMGITCYNAGYDGNGIILAYGILSLIDDGRLPRVIVYDVKQQFDIYQYSGDGDHTRYYQYLKPFYGNPSVDGIIGSVSHFDVLKLRSSLYRTNGDLMNLVSGYLKQSPEDMNMGFQPMVGLIDDVSEQEKDYSNEIDSLKLGYFKKFVALTKEKGIKLFVVFSPEYNTPYSDDLNPIREICLTEGVTLLDYFNEPSFLKKEFFKDHCHMNENGATTYSAAIASDIQRITNVKYNNNNERD